MKYVLAIDQGTSSSRGIIFDEQLRQVGIGQEALESQYPHDGWVEQRPEEILQSTLRACRQAIADARIDSSQIAGIGITNQRETSIVWDAETSEPLGKAIVWQDRRTHDYCERLKEDGMAESISEQTGLVIDPYFSSTKLAWILDQSDHRRIADAGRLRWGTVDSYLMWRLTKGRVHVTDATNVSRTQLFDIRSNEWSTELLDYFRIPRSLLPRVMDCSGCFGVADSEWFGSSIPILGVAGDQQAALIGQACFQGGMAKSTYGTGCFLIVNTGRTKSELQSSLLGTIAYRLDGETFYGVEGSIFNAGTAIQWLRDQMGLVSESSETGEIARRTNGDTRGVFVVPAFTGLGAPYWNSSARGLICGLTRDAGIDEVVTATLKSVAFQTVDLLHEISADSVDLNRVRIDGGMAQNDWFCQFLSDITGLYVDRPQNTETTAVGAAVLAWLALGTISSLEDASKRWTLDRTFIPSMKQEQRKDEISQWAEAVRRAL